MHIGVIPSSTSNSKILLPYLSAYLSVHEVRLNTADSFQGVFLLLQVSRATENRLANFCSACNPVSFDHKSSEATTARD